MIRECCVCLKVERKGQWFWDRSAAVQNVSHVYCPKCYEDLMDRIDLLAQKKWRKTVYTISGTGKSCRVLCD